MRERVVFARFSEPASSTPRPDASSAPAPPLSLSLTIHTSPGLKLPGSSGTTAPARLHASCVHRWHASHWIIFPLSSSHRWHGSTHTSSWCAFSYGRISSAYASKIAVVGSNPGG